MYPVFLALRYARSRAVTYLALLTVAVSVGSFVVVMSVLGGFRHEVEQIIQETGAPLEIYCSATYGIEDADGICARLARLPGVRGASPYYQTMALIRTARFRTLGVVHGVDLARELRYGKLGGFIKGEVPVENIDGLEEVGPLTTGPARAAPRSFEVPPELARREVDKETLQPWENPDRPEQRGTVPVWPGAKEPEGQRPRRPEGLVPAPGAAGAPALKPIPRGVIVGAKRARRLGLYAGDEIILAVQGGGETLRVRSFTVIGFYESKTDWLNDIILVDGRAAADLAGQQEATGISIWLENPRDAFSLREAVRGVFREDRFTKVRTWKESREDIFGMMDMQNQVMMIILLIFFVMTGAFIMAILWVLVSEKTRDIGTVRALGGGRLGTVVTFVSQGLAISILGVGTGLGAGWLLSKNVNAVVEHLDSALMCVGAEDVFGSISRQIFDMKELPVHYEWGTIIIMVAVTVAVSFVASLLPALRAARMDPVEALRHE